MKSSHTIRLHAAWKRMVSGRAGQLGEPVSVSLPDQDLSRCEADSVTYQRRFNRPTGMDGAVAVYLDCGLLPLAVSATLNGYPLDSSTAAPLEITSLLRPHNQLEIVLTSAHYAEASSASAKLEIIAAL